MTYRSLLILLPTLALSGAAGAWSQIYKVTDDERGVVFTDRPETVQSTNDQNVEAVELQETNTTAPVTPRPAAPTTPSAPVVEEVIAPTVTITSPANESTIAMGPGNFAVSASVAPPLGRNERLELIMDGQPIGAAQSSASWFIEGALRGPHDLVVRRTDGRGKTLVVSE
ncbi:unnamed protein product, partial [Ectocarpus sp. 12 AP-2014]